MSSILFTSLLIFIYPYFYSQGISIVYGVFIFTVLYLVLEYKGLIKQVETKVFQKNKKILFSAVILLSVSLMIVIPIEFRVVMFLIVLTLLSSNKLDIKYLLYFAIITFVGFLFFGNIFQIMIGKIMSYLSRGVESEGLHFYQVVQTVREAGTIPFSTMANRISGSQVGVLISFVGYVVLVVRHKPFIIALPLIGVGVLSLWAGLRFTVYAVPIAAISAVYLFYVIADMFFQNKMMKYGFIVLATAMMIYPNINHIIGYKVPTVLNKTEVNDLVKLEKMSDPKDYTLTWWDYGYPIWFYSNTNTLIDGGKHTNDNFIVSKIMQTTSPELAASLSRLAIETYIDSNYTIVANTLFKNKKDDQVDPNFLLSELENGTYVLPQKTRDIYLYLPYRMLNIFPTVAVFGNLDLTTGKVQRKITFYPTAVGSEDNGIIAFRNGILFDTHKGEISIGKQKKLVKYFIGTQNTENGKVKLQSQLYHVDGTHAVVYMKSYGRFVVMDIETFKSTYVQMFILGKYDKNLFELVISSAYSKIYKLKK